MITNFFDTQKNKKISYNKNVINKLKDETQIQKHKQIKLGESLEQEIHVKTEKKREQYINFLIDKIKTLQLELEETNQTIKECHEIKKISLGYDEIINNLNTKLIELNIEKNKHTKILDDLEKQLRQSNTENKHYNKIIIQLETQLKNVDTEKKNYKQKIDELEERLKQIIMEQNTYNSKLEQTEKQLKQIDAEKQTYKVTLEQTEKQLKQIDTEKHKYKSNLELYDKYIQFMTQENHNYKDILLKNENIIQHNMFITNIPTIYIIYQYTYKNNVQVTGFGDFIRCCFYILQFSDSYNLHIDFNIYKHPIKKYLKYFSLKEDITELISTNISFFQKQNHNYFVKNNIVSYTYYNIDYDLLQTIRQTKTYNKNKYLYLINHPNEQHIEETHKQKIQQLFEPTVDLQIRIDIALSNINLIKYKYKIIHVRMNDNSFHGDYINFTNEQMNYIINIINSIKKNTDDEIFLMSSNNVLKKCLIQKLPNVKTIFSEISHIGESKIDNDETLISTLIDFYTMSYSNRIYSFSVYDHGSGFSKWCAKMYNIPYVCFKI